MTKAIKKKAKNSRVTFVGGVYSLNVHGTENANSSIELGAVLLNGDTLVAVRAGAGNDSKNLIVWSTMILAAYLDRRTDGKGRNIRVVYSFNEATSANEIESVVFPYLAPKGRR